MDETISFAAALQRQIYELVRAHELCDRACLAQNGVTAAQGYTLLAFPEQGGMTMNALSDQMRLSSSTMTRMIDQLVQKGFVLRRPDDEDRQSRACRTHGPGARNPERFGAVFAGSI